MKKLYIPICMSMILIFFGTGCWDYIEYENIAQVYGVGIDYQKSTHKVTVCIQYILPQNFRMQNMTQMSNDVTYSASAKTIVDALEKLQEVIPSKLFYGYMMVFVIGENAAKSILPEILGILQQTPNIRDSLYMIVTHGTAEGLLGTSEKISTEPSAQKLHMLLDASKGSGNAIIVTLHNFVEMLAKGGIEPMATGVDTTGKSHIGQATGGIHRDLRFNIKNNGNYFLNGMAAFKGYKLVGWLDDKETKSISLIRNEKSNFYEVTRDVDKISPTNKSTLYFQITNSKAEINTRIFNGKPKINIKVTLQANLMKYYTEYASRYFTPSEIHVMEKKLGKSVASDIKSSINKIQKKLKTDVFGFGFNLFRQYPQEWHKNYEKKWSKIFPEVPISVGVQANIYSTGINIKPLWKK